MVVQALQAAEYLGMTVAVRQDTVDEIGPGEAELVLRDLGLVTEKVFGLVSEKSG
jgi:hypothetical protein